MITSYEKIKSLFRNALWWCSGVNTDVLLKFPSDWQRFYSIGLASLLSVIAGQLGVTYALSSFINTFLSIIAGFLWGLAILVLNRFSIIARSNRRLNNVLLALIRTVIAIVVGIVIAIPLQLSLFNQSISSKLQSGGIKSGDFLQRIAAFSDLQQNSVPIKTASYLMIFLFVSLELIPVILNVMVGSGSYERGLEEARYFEAKINASTQEAELDLLHIDLDSKRLKNKLKEEAAQNQLQYNINKNINNKGLNQNLIFLARSTKSDIFNH